MAVAVDVDVDVGVVRAHVREDVDVQAVVVAGNLVVVVARIVVVVVRIAASGYSSKIP